MEIKMDINKDNLPKQNMTDLIRSLELISARVFQSLLTLSQTASSTTPEMQKLFQEWINCLGDEIEREVSEKGEIDPEIVAKKIGVDQATIISLALTLHRQGHIKIKSIWAESCDLPNSEICDCLNS